MKSNRENTEKLLQDIFQKKILVKGVVSNMKGNYPYSKVNIKPLLIKNNFFFQKMQILFSLFMPATMQQIMLF